MVHALATDRSNQSFGKAVLPRRTWRDGLVTDTHRSQSAHRRSAVDLISITDHVARSLIPRECFHDLTCDPFRGRMRCDIDPHKISAREPDDNSAVEQIKANGWNNEQVHGGDVGRMVTQEDAPPLGRWSTSLDHVLRDVD